MDNSKLPEVVLAFDPGGTTGWARWNSPEFINKSQGESAKFCGGQLGPNSHHAELWDFLTTVHHLTAGNMLVVTESFEFRNNVDTEDRRSGLELISREYIGIIRLFGYLFDVDIAQQMPSEAKNFVSNERLRCMDLLPEPSYPMRHMLDGYRHLILLLCTKSKFREVRKEIIKSWKSQG